MCVAYCLRCVGVALVPLALLCILTNFLLLLPNLQLRFLLEGHVTSEATWATGLWGSGFLVLFAARSFFSSSKTRGWFSFRFQMLCQLLYSSLALLASGFCCLVSCTALAQGPLCLYNSSTGPEWGVPLQPIPGRFPGYLYNSNVSVLSVCVEPRGVVQWNLVLFGVQGGCSALQTLICSSNLLNVLLGALLGPGCLPSNKVVPVSV